MKRGEFRHVLRILGLMLWWGGLLATVVMLADQIFEFGGSGRSSLNTSFSVIILVALGGILLLLVRIDERLAAKE